MYSRLPSEHQEVGKILEKENSIFWTLILQQGTDSHRTHRAPQVAKQDAN